MYKVIISPWSLVWLSLQLDNFDWASLRSLRGELTLKKLEKMLWMSLCILTPNPKIVPKVGKLCVEPAIISTI